MNESIYIPSIAGLLGILVGGFIQAILNRKNQHKSHIADLKSKAYSDFLNATSQIAVAQRLGQTEIVKTELSKLADAKSRICIYGDAPVIHLMAKFLRNGGTLQTEREIVAFSQLCISLRESSIMRKSDIHPADISQLLFNLDIKNTKTP